ncbi:MAG TPA: nucleoside deaminase [Sphingomonas sp.]|nr:nucleoside deaminase [Sphingomonas sp.]
MDDAETHLNRAVALAAANVEAGGRPFGAVLVRDGTVVATGVNTVLVTHDPTGHAELNAIRAASAALGTADLSGGAVYASGQPCPMCMAAMRLAGIGEVVFACSNADGEPYGLSTAAIYADLARPFADQSMRIRHLPVTGGTDPYREWARRAAGR